MMKTRIFFLLACIVLLSVSGEAAVVRERQIAAADLADLRLQTGGSLTLPTFGEDVLTVRLGARRTTAEGVSTFGAKVAGSAGRDAVVVQTPEGFILRARDARTGHLLEFTRNRQGLRVVERSVEPSGPRVCQPGKRIRQTSRAKSADVVRKALSGNPMVDGRAILKGETRTNAVDILIAFDSSGAEWVRTESVFADAPDPIAAFAADRVENMNNALANTGLDASFSFSLTGTLVIGKDWDCSGYSDDRQSEAFDLMLDVLAAGEGGKEVRAAREACGADIVVFLVGANDHGRVGLSWALDDESIGGGGFDDYAFCVCAVASADDGHILTHEIGHVMGAGHAEMREPSGSGPQLYDYSSGYTFLVTNECGEAVARCHTIMGYGVDGFSTGGFSRLDEVPYFSSSRHTFVQESYDAETDERKLVDTGIAVGDAQHDNTRLLSLTYPLVANFRVRKSGLTIVTPDGGAASVSPSGTTVSSGATISIKAVPATGYLFAGWYEAYDEATGVYSKPAHLYGDLDYRMPSARWTVPSGEATDVVLYARFVTVESERKEEPLISCELAAEGYEPGSAIAPIPVSVDARTMPTVTVKGLPTGLKFDAKTLRITGNPSKPGLYALTLEAKNQAKVTRTLTAELRVRNFTDPLVTWDEETNPTGIMDAYGPLIPGETVDYQFPCAKGWSASGLPSGLKFDGKTGRLSGAPVKPGSTTATFKATLLDAKTGKRIPHVATVTFIVDKFRHLALDRTEDSTGTGRLTGGGSFIAGKKVSVKATADTKDTPTTKRSVFMAWYLNGVLVSKEASYSYVMTTEPEQRLEARFITAEEDAAAITLSVGGEELSAKSTASWTNVCGVATAWEVLPGGLSATTVKAAGLPAGLKLVQDKVTKAYSITGAPSAESKLATGGAARTPSLVKFSVVTAGKSTQTFLVAMTVLPLDDWAKGSFVGGGAACQGTLTVAKTGKISGKVQGDDGMWTLTAASFSALREDGAYEAAVIAKNGRLSTTNELVLTSATVGPSVLGVVDERSGAYRLCQSPWAMEPWKSEAKGFAKAQPLKLEGERFGLKEGEYIALKFAAAGKVTIAGQFLITAAGKTSSKSVSGSSLLVPMAGGEAYALNLFLAPKASFPGYCCNLSLLWDGASFSVAEEDQEGVTP